MSGQAGGGSASCWERLQVAWCLEAWWGGGRAQPHSVGSESPSHNHLEALGARQPPGFSFPGSRRIWKFSCSSDEGERGTLLISPGAQGTQGTMLVLTGIGLKSSQLWCIIKKGFGKLG